MKSKFLKKEATMRLLSITLDFVDEETDELYTVGINEEFILVDKSFIPIEAARLARKIAAYVNWFPAIPQPQGSEDGPCKDCSCVR
jgi:hypothetical protein